MHRWWSRGGKQDITTVLKQRLLKLFSLIYIVIHMVSSGLRTLCVQQENQEGCYWLMDLATRDYTPKCWITFFNSEKWSLLQIIVKWDFSLKCSLKWWSTLLWWVGVKTEEDKEWTNIFHRGSGRDGENKYLLLLWVIQKLFFPSGNASLLYTQNCTTSKM